MKGICLRCLKISCLIKDKKVNKIQYNICKSCFESLSQRYGKKYILSAFDKLMQARLENIKDLVAIEVPDSERKWNGPEISRNVGNLLCNGI